MHVTLFCMFPNHLKMALSQAFPGDRKAEKSDIRRIGRNPESQTLKTGPIRLETAKVLDLTPRGPLVPLGERLQGSRPQTQWLSRTGQQGCRENSLWRPGCEEEKAEAAVVAFKQEELRLCE